MSFSAFLKERSLSKLLSAILMVAGTTIGAGMLGMPLITAQCGFLPAAMVSVVVWLFMCVTGLMLVEVCLRSPASLNILGITKYWLGSAGRGIAGGCFIFLYYCLLVAYFAAGALLVSSFTGINGGFSLLAFAGCFAVVVARGSRSIHKVNTILTVAMFICYAALIVLGSPSVSFSYLCRSEFSLSYFAMPVLFCSFGYHNIIPSLVAYNEGNRRVLRLSIVLGTSLALVVFLIWQWLIIGSIPQNLLQQAAASGFPATQALHEVVGRPYLFSIGQLFAFFALTSSLLGVCFSMVDFLKEALGFIGGNLGRKWLTFFVFLPPVICVMINPAVFEKSLGLAGGVGESVLNGFIPMALFWAMNKKKSAQKSIASLKVGLAFLAVFCSFVLYTEILSLVR